jgi:hypothetical protein
MVKIRGRNAVEPEYWLKRLGSVSADCRHTAEDPAGRVLGHDAIVTIITDASYGSILNCVGPPPLWSKAGRDGHA